MNFPVKSDCSSTVSPMRVMPSLGAGVSGTGTSCGASFDCFFSRQSDPVSLASMWSIARFSPSASSSRQLPSSTPEP